MIVNLRYWGFGNRRPDFEIISSLLLVITMEKTFSQIEFNMFLSMLNDYLAAKEDSLMRLRSDHTRLIENQKANDFPNELITYAKQVLSQIDTYFTEIKDFFDDAKMDTTFDFFHKCFTITDKTIRALSDALRYSTNRTIDGPSRLPAATVTNTIHCEGDRVEKPKKQPRPAILNRQELKRVTQIISKDLQSIDYCLNMLTAEDLKTYNDRKFQFEKLMHHRRSIESINPSQATKQIMQTANLIEGAAQNAQKAFQESYLMNYFEFKSYIANLQSSEALVDSFKKDMETHTKEKFIEAITKNADRILNNQKDFRKLHQVSLGVQTDDSKGKIHEKMQHLLISEKKNNEKLAAEIQTLKKNSANYGVDKGELFKKMDKQVNARKQIESKYIILEKLYNQKCSQLSAAQALQKSSVFRTEVPDRSHHSSIASQTLAQMFKPKEQVSRVCQTDVDFYYYFQNRQLSQLQNKIYELESIVNHKDYVIKQLEAVKTFRDKFKSKKEIFSAVLIPKKSAAEAKSLRYLRQQEQASLEAKENILNSLEAGSTKRLVTFRDGIDNDDGEVSTKSFHLRKKSKKLRGESRNQTYYALNDKVTSNHKFDEHITSKNSYQNPHQVSLKSILKMGYTSHSKIQSSIYAASDGLNKDTIVETSEPAQKKREAQKKTRNNQSTNSKEALRQTIRPSMTSTIKSSRADRSSGLMEVRRSNFLFTEDSPFLKTEQSEKIPPLGLRNSQTISLSPVLKKQHHEKYKPLPKVSRLNDPKQSPANHQVVHMNKTINLNFECNLPQKLEKVKHEKENRGTGNRRGPQYRTYKKKK